MLNNVSKHMTTQVLRVAPDAPVSDVLEAMRTKSIRHVAVTDARGELRGVISDRDILGMALGPLSWLPDDERQRHLAEMQAYQLMTEQPVTIGPSESLSTAAERIVTHKIGCLPVVEHGQLMGILTESDFARLTAQGVLVEAA